MDDVMLWLFLLPLAPFCSTAKSPSRFRAVSRLARVGSDRAT